MEIRPTENYIIIDDVESLGTDRDFNASLNAIKPFIDSISDAETESFLMRDFIINNVWNGYTEPSEKQVDGLRYVVRTQYHPKQAIVLCYELDREIERQITNWSNNLVNVAVYIRSIRRFIPQYTTNWDTLTIDTYGDYDSDRYFVHKWYRPLGVMLSAPPLSEYQADEDITNYAKRPIDRNNDDRHITKPTTTAIKYHLHKTAITPQTELMKAKTEIEYILNAINKGDIYASDALAPNWYFCPYCGEPTYSGESSKIISVESHTISCGTLNNECNECHRKFTFNHHNRPIQL